MKQDILNHYKSTGTYTYAGLYADYFKSLPNDIRQLGNLICSQVIHRVTLREGNSGANSDLTYGDMTRFPWYRLRCEDDVLLTAMAMTAEWRCICLDRTINKKQYPQRSEDQNSVLLKKRKAKEEKQNGFKD
ncbi:MAG TPA: hypothetical protein PKZ69_06860 [Candidatus Cloacimonadota bacterium]|nr:hypothetical protein [Candidatus Cloacimonadota bacterium]